LVEVARSRGVPAHLIDDETDIETSWLSGVETLGLTSGASVPESLVRRVLSWFGERGVQHIISQTTITEDVAYRPPAELKQQTTAERQQSRAVGR
jgi:4-hydroxy-3-methylbut-2-enyl diphosphate reductase